MGKEMFKDVLYDDEEILSVYKPMKGPYFMSHILPALFSIIILSFFLILSFVFHTETLIYCVLIFLVSCLFGITGLIMKIYNYKNTYYCITNKRLLKRECNVAIDFQSVDLKDIEEIDVYYEFYDRLCGYKSGKISVKTNNWPLVESRTAFSFNNVGNINLLSENLRKMVKVVKNLKIDEETYKELLKKIID